MSDKMHLFQSIQRSFALVGISSYQARQKNSFSPKILATLISYIITIISYNLYLFRVASTFFEYTDSIYNDSVSTLTVIFYIMFIFGMTEIFEIIDDCETVTVKSVDYPESMAIYIEVHQRIEKFSENIYFLLVKVMPVCMLLPKCFGCIYIYFTTDLGSEAFELPLPMWFPFDSKNLRGYLFAVAFEYVANVHLYMFSAEFTSLGVGAFLFTMSMIEDIKNNLNSINKIVKTKRTPLELQKKMLHCIQLYLDGKQLVKKFAKEIQPVNFSLYSWIFTAICGSLLMIQMELSHPNTDVVVLFTVIFYAFFAFGVVFMSCEIGQRMSNAFEEIEDVTGQCSWYLFPLDVQRMFPMITISLQEAVELPIMGTVSCGRDTFEKMIKTGFSFFTVLRRFS